MAEGGSEAVDTVSREGCGAFPGTLKSGAPSVLPLHVQQRGNPIASKETFF